MPKRKTSSLAVLTKLTPARAGVRFAEGNGRQPKTTDAERLARLEELLVTIQHDFDIQTQRIAEMQVLIDRLIARS
jgi:hypothetical protein